MQFVYTHAVQFIKIYGRGLICAYGERCTLLLRNLDASILGLPYSIQHTPEHDGDGDAAAAATGNDSRKRVFTGAN